MMSMRIGVGLSILMLAISSSGAAPISFNTALPVHEGGLLFHGEGIWMRMHNDPSPMNRQMDVVAVPSVLVYGATPKLALMGVFPYLDKKLTIGSLGVTREASGLGDIMTIARYEVFERNRSGQTTRGALFTGLKWPTGKDNAADAMGLLPRPVQLGSGSYDPIAGTVWTKQSLPFEVDADFFYQRNNPANDFKFGDVFQEDLSFQYRLWPMNLGSQGVPRYLYGVFEVNSSYQAKNEASGIKDDDSGGYQLFLTPGLQWVEKRVVLELATQWPAVQSLNGNALKSDYTLIGGFRLWF